jgi:hypothetical protein
MNWLNWVKFLIIGRSTERPHMSDEEMNLSNTALQPFRHKNVVTTDFKIIYVRGCRIPGSDMLCAAAKFQKSNTNMFYRIHWHEGQPEKNLVYFPNVRIREMVKQEVNEADVVETCLTTDVHPI